MDLQPLAQLLQLSLDPSQNKQAEKTIREEEKKPGFSISLLHIVATDSFPSTIRLASALYFKNFIKRNWVDEEGQYQLPENEVVAIKSELIGLMIRVPPAIQSQLGEAISTIAESDFYERWDTLVDDLVSRLTVDDAVVNNGVLQVAHSIFRRWRPLYRSDDLFTEINHVVGKFGQPFLQLIGNTDAAITQNQNNKVALQQHLTTFNLIVKLIYDLSCQDLPPVFEDNISAVADLLHKYLVYDNPIVHTDDESESGVLEHVKSGILEVLILWVQKFDDAFGQFAGNFISSSWNLLTTVGSEVKYDILVSKALQFLTSVAKFASHAGAFKDEAVQSQIVEKVIIPNLTLRESDIELFEDEPIEFIRRDLEGSDSDTRRRAATDFLRQLMEQFEDSVTSVVSKYLTHFLQDYAKNPQSQWKSKDTAIYLFTSIAAKGTVTAAQGVKTVNTKLDIVQFFQEHIASDLTGTDVQPILKVDAIKYLYIFRSQIAPQYWQAAFPLLVQHLNSDNYVVYTYAAIAVERVLYLTSEDQQSYINHNDVVALSKDLLQHLFYLIQKDSAPEKVQENEFLMRCVMRVLIVIKEGVIPITSIVLDNFIAITREISKNPSNPRFYYYHFEGLGALIRFAAPSQPDVMEKRLYDPFAAVLQEDVTEFVPYVFQLFAALLEANPAGTLSAYYQSLIEPIITPSIWESRGNVPALVRLLSSVIARGADMILQNNQLEPILGIFQKLIATKVHEAYAFDLIEIIVESFPPQALEQYFIIVVQLMLTRLSNSKTELLSQRFIRFFHLVAARDGNGLGTDFFIKVTDQIQNDVFKPIYLTVILPDTQKLSRPTDRKTAVVSFTKTLANSEAFVSRYPKGWGLTCSALLKLLINPPVPPKADDIIPEQDVDDLTFGVGFTPLNTCKRQPRDVFPEISDIKAWVGSYLKEADGKYGGRISGFVGERLNEEQRSTLLSYMG